MQLDRFQIIDDSWKTWYHKKKSFQNLNYGIDRWDKCKTQNKLPMKIKDWGSFTLPISFGENCSFNALFDTGMSINLIPSSIYTKLGLGEVKEKN